MSEKGSSSSPTGCRSVNIKSSSVQKPSLSLSWGDCALHEAADRTTLSGKEEGGGDYVHLGRQVLRFPDLACVIRRLVLSLAGHRSFRLAVGWP